MEIIVKCTSTHLTMGNEAGTVAPAYTSQARARERPHPGVVHDMLPLLSSQRSRSHKIVVHKRSKPVRRLIVLACVTLATLSGAALGSGHGVARAASEGNSDAAHACQHGGYLTLLGGTPPQPNGDLYQYRRLRELRGTWRHPVYREHFNVLCRRNGTGVPGHRGQPGVRCDSDHYRDGNSLWGYCTQTGVISSCPVAHRRSDQTVCRQDTTPICWLQR